MCRSEAKELTDLLAVAGRRLAVDLVAAHQVRTAQAAVAAVSLPRAQQVLVPC